MAPSSRRRKLICHYCNRKSDFIYDGKVTQWECNNCNAVNYLDENGEITDPPVAELSSAAPPVRFATSSFDSVLPLSQDASQNNIFCARCLKNQHLYTSSLAQYHVEIDTDSFELEKKNGAYSRFRKDLERRYPQVCESCEPAALQRMKEAGKTAKADHLRRLMDKTRASRSRAVQKSALSLDNIGKIIWSLGLFGQLLWNIAAVISCTLENYMILVTISSNIHQNRSQLSPIITIARSLAFKALLCTFLSSWWSPKYGESSKSFTKHIYGFKDWYQLQLITILLRSLFYFIMGTRFFSDLLSPITAGAHSVMFILTSSLAIKARNTSQMNTTPLWNNIPEKLTISRSRTQSLSGTQESMGDVLDQISSESHSPPLGTLESCIPNSSNILRNFPASSNHMCLDPENTVFEPLTSSRFRENAEKCLSFKNEDNQPGYDEMDWQLTQSPTFNFNPRPKIYPPLSTETSSSNRPPTFWYKLPPAPLTPAQRILGHPNNAKRQSSNLNTEQIKPIFFRDTTKKDTFASKQLLQDNNTQSRPTKLGIEFSPQKFFPPEPTSEAGNILADLLTDFSLTNAEEKVKMSSNRTNHVVHFITFAVLVISVAYGWYIYQLNSE